MASNPWLAGVNVSKCPVCDVRLLNGSCIDHGPPAAEEVEDWPEDLDEPTEPETQPGDPKPAEPEKPEEPQQQPEDKLEEKPEDKPEESQKKRRKRAIVDTDSEDTPASSSADKQTEPPPKGDEALH
jgi:outer membrane biosynthesis protein TonB